MTEGDPLYSPEAPLLSPEGLGLQALKAPVALTGATGFVGSHLVDTLVAAGLRPRLLVRSDRPRWLGGLEGLTFIRGSLEDPAALEELVDGAETVLHLAGALRAPSAAAFHEGNAGGTSRVVEATRKRSPKAFFLYCSSQAALGPAPDAEGLPPEALPRPISAYGRSKAAAEEVVRNSGLSWSIVRPPAIFGPRDGDILEFFRMASRGLVAWPSGSRLLSIACVDEVLKVLLAVACRREEGRIEHVVPHPPLEMEEMLREIARGSGRSCRFLPIPAWMLRTAGLGGSALRSLGLSRIPISRDKAREILARHWVLNRGNDPVALSPARSLAQSLELSWQWYRKISWLPSPRH